MLVGDFLQRAPISMSFHLESDRICALVNDFSLRGMPCEGSR
jgi:hypothetical protein